ncbi:4'-phosphopantetheinyl transferase family protein [Aegicerativicinus sediminis]|uniref:4'-phosphopantetheinyl transferase family protein n=1 Tax=Aegicerativicinus sediminis TaxID=2893202 RepID=UPI001E498434|nr:4'-phosphopantetheinyl transferase superfamily protein [Aegicerativicinus sediminis]
MSYSKIHWLKQPQTTYPIPLNTDQHIQLYSADLSKDFCDSLDYIELLSENELIRMKRLRFKKDKLNFIKSRGFLRLILGQHLQLDPKCILFSYEENGKPVLAEINYGNLHFNLSHSRNKILLAISDCNNIGVDIEYVNPAIDSLSIANKFFSEVEARTLESTHGNERLNKFFQFWTRKEALVKGLGDGLGFPFQEIDVSKLKGTDWDTLTNLTSIGRLKQWYSIDVPFGKSYKASLAVDCSD